MTKNTCAIYPFVKATKGNWRNAIHISCSCETCPFGHPKVCEGFLMTANSDGTPYILSVEKYRTVTKEPVDPEECCGAMTRQAFEAVYALYLQWHLSSLQDCPLLVHSMTVQSSCPY